MTERRAAQHPLSRLAVLLVTLAAVPVVGCVRTTTRSGLAPGVAPEGWTDRWHHAFLFGLDELPGPITPERVCPLGWAQIDTLVDPMQGTIAVLTLGIYTPTTVTVVCADPDYRPRHSR